MNSSYPAGGYPVGYLMKIDVYNFNGSIYFGTTYRKEDILMQIGVNIINPAMDSVFNNGSLTYAIKLAYDGGTESTANAVDFTKRLWGSSFYHSVNLFCCLKWDNRNKN